MAKGNRTGKGQFKKGQPSPNPGGRPKTKPLSDAVRSEMERISKLEGESEKMSGYKRLARALVTKACAGDLHAVEVVFERLEGKPEQAISLDGKNGESLSVTINLG